MLAQHKGTPGREVGLQAKAFLAGFSVIDDRRAPGVPFLVEDQPLRMMVGDVVVPLDGVDGHPDAPVVARFDLLLEKVALNRYNVFGACRQMFRRAHSGFCLAVFPRDHGGNWGDCVLLGLMWRRWRARLC